MNRKMLLALCTTLTVALLFGMNLWAAPSGESASQGTAAMSTGEFNESPMLSALVGRGELPPVDERLPLEPLVKIAPEIGNYGGTAQSLSVNSFHDGDLYGWAQSAYTLEVTPDFKVGPGIAKGYELSADQKTFTLYLREGMKWSDGEPFTADAYIFRYKDLGMHPDVPTGYRNEPIVSMTAVDDLTLRITFSDPFPKIPINMANEDGADWSRIRPKHYLKNWHLDYNPDANDLAKEEGFDNWGQALLSHANWNPVQDRDVPTLRPFLLREENANTRLYERNPYWYAVDSAGNQLPYFDKVQTTIVDSETYKLKAVNGEVTFGKFPAFADFTLYKQNEGSGDYNLLSLSGSVGGQHTYHINQNHEEPLLAEVLRDLRFRQALSLAIDREEMNETIYSGMGVPRAMTINSDVSFYRSEWGEDHPYARYDPAAANRLLDDMGLTEKDRDGFRTLSDGKTINLSIVFYEGWLESEGWELTKEYWGDVGLKTTLRAVESGLFWGLSCSPEFVIASRRGTNSTEVSSDRGRGGIASPLQCPSWSPAWREFLQAKYNIDTGSKTLADYEGGRMPGEEPPAPMMKLWDGIMKAANSEFGSRDYADAYQDVFDVFAEQLYVIGTVGLVPDLVLSKRNVGNTSAEWIASIGGKWSQYDSLLYFK